MDKQKYWQQRQKQLWSNLERSERALEADLAKYYTEQVEAIESKIASYYGKYGKDGVIEYRELLKSLSESEKAKLYRDFEGFVKQYPQYKHLAPIRNTIYKLDRLQGLEYNIRLELLKSGAVEAEKVTKHLSDNYKSAYLESAKAAGFKVDTVSAKALLNQDWTGYGNYSQRIWDNKDRLQNYLTHDLRNGIIRGDSYAKLTKQLRDRFSKRSNSDIKRLVTTEGTFIENQAMIKPFEESGQYDEFEFVAVSDSHTSDICRGLDWKTFKLSEKQVGVNFPPMHPNCRSTFAIVISSTS